MAHMSAEQQTASAQIQKIAKNVEVEGNKITFTSREAVETFEIKYQGVDGASTFSTLGNNTPRSEKFLKNKFKEIDGAISTTTSIASSDRYECKITPQADGTTKFVITFNEKIQNAHIEVNNKVSQLKLHQGKLDPSLNVSDTHVNASNSSSQNKNQSSPAQSNAAAVNQVLDPRDIDTLSVDKTGTQKNHSAHGNGKAEQSNPEKSKGGSGNAEAAQKNDIASDQEKLVKRGTDQGAYTQIKLPKFAQTPPPQHYAPGYTGYSESAAYAAGQARNQKPLTADEKMAAVKESLEEIKKQKIDSQETLASKTEEVEKLSKSYEKLQKSEIKALEKALSKEIENSKEALAIKSKIEAINATREDFLNTKKLLAEQAISSSNKDLSLAGKREMISLRKDILERFDQRAAKAASPAEIKSISAERDIFISANDDYIKEVGTKGQKMALAVQGSKVYEWYTKLNEQGSKVYQAAKGLVAQNAVKSAETIVALDGKDLDQTSVRKLEKIYGRLEKAEELAKVEASKNPAKVAELEKVSELKAKIALKLEEKLVTEVEQAKKLSVDTKYQSKLYSEHSEKILSAKEKLGQNADDYKVKQNAYADGQAKNATLKQNEWYLSEARSISSRLSEVEYQLKKNPQSDLLITEKKYLELSRDQIVLEKQISKLDPNKDNTAILEKREALHKTNQELLEAKADYRDQIEKKLADDSIDSSERTKLEKAKVKIDKSVSKLEADEVQELSKLEKSRTLAASQASIEQLEEVHEKLEAKRAELKNTEDVEIQKRLGAEITDLERTQDVLNKAKIETEIDANTRVNKILEERISQIDKSLKASDLTKERSIELTKEHKALTKQLAASKSNNEYLTGKKQILDTRVEFANKDAQLQRLQGELEKATDTVTKQNLAKEIYDLKPAVKSLADQVTAQEKSFKNVWNNKMIQARAMFQKDVMPKMMRQNPALTATVVGMLSEASFSALSADYSPEGKHSALPSLITMMNQDLREWTEFTTADYNYTFSALAEMTNSAGNVGIIAGTFYVGQKGLGYVGMKAPPVALLRVAGLAGVAYNGYSKFANMDLANSTDTQIVGNVGSTMAAGVITGAALGTFIPIPFVGTGAGAVVGGVVAFGADMYGTASNLAYLDDLYKSDYVKKGIKESIVNASNGLIRAKDNSGVYNGTLSEEAQEVIDSLAKAQILAQVFDGRDEKGKALFSRSDIVALGFKLPTDKMSEEESRSLQSENWQRVEELFERGEGWVFRDQINYLKEQKTLTREQIANNKALEAQIAQTKDEKEIARLKENFAKPLSELGAKFEQIRNASYENTEDHYRRSYKIEIQADFPNSAFDIWVGINSNDMGGAKITKHEFLAEAEMQKGFAEIIESGGDKDAVFDLIRENYPELDRIMRDENTANLFVNAFMSKDPQTHAYTETALSKMLREYYIKTKDAPLQLNKNIDEIVKL